MTVGRCGAAAFRSRWSLPVAESAGAWRDALSAAGLTVTRARAARLLGDPDPFHVRELAFAAAAEAPVHLDTVDGRPLSPDHLDAALAEQALDQDCTEALQLLVAGRRMSPGVRAVLLERGAPTMPRLARWRSPNPAPPPCLGTPEWIPTTALGEPEVATIRALLTLPDGRLAAGTDYGLSLFDGTAWSAFPYPRGSRREARSVDAMAVREGTLHVATPKTRFAWPLDADQPSVYPLPRDDDGGHDDIRSMLATPSGLLTGWRLGLNGGEGLPETLSLALDPDGNAWGGTRDGRLYVVGHPGRQRRFVSGGKPRPIRYMTRAGGALFIAAAGALHRFDGATWSHSDGEPVFLTEDGQGRLWAILGGTVRVGDANTWPVPLDLPIERPWCLAFAQGSVWVGSVGGLLRVPLRDG